MFFFFARAFLMPTLIISEKFEENGQILVTIPLIIMHQCRLIESSRYIWQFIS